MQDFLSPSGRVNWKAWIIVDDGSSEISETPVMLSDSWFYERVGQVVNHHKSLGLIRYSNLSYRLHVAIGQRMQKDQLEASAEWYLSHVERLDTAPRFRWSNISKSEGRAPQSVLFITTKSAVSKSSDPSVRPTYASTGSGFEAGHPYSAQRAVTDTDAPPSRIHTGYNNVQSPARSPAALPRLPIIHLRERLLKRKDLAITQVGVLVLGRTFEVSLKMLSIIQCSCSDI